MRDHSAARLHPDSVAVAAGRPPREPDAPVNQPITPASTFHAGGPRGYARAGTDGSAAFEAALGALEGGSTVSFASGMAATAAVLAMLPASAALVIPTGFYNYHRTFFDNELALGRLGELRPVDITDSQAVIAALPGASLLWLEAPTNPSLLLPDLPRLAAAAREAGVLSVVDATVATPIGVRPLEHGLDIVMHSATKWIAGHSDVLMGVLSVTDAELHQRLMTQRNLTGATPGALESYLALRGLRTLPLRMQRCCQNAAVLAERLAEHPRVSAVTYLGSAEHPQAELVAKLMDHHGAVISFTLDSVAAADELCRRVELITHATSLGGVESLIERRGKYPGEQALGSPAELVRLSVGIEHAEDLWTDLSQALA